ncbi:Chromosome partition protein Smc [uncultured archaeon]|nr:Chromosome partition protein Smc [uncultured archaeon]
MRERRTLLLLVVAPLLVLFILSLVFSGNSLQAKAAEIGVCDLDGSNSSQFFIESIGNRSPARLYPKGDGCASSLEEDVRGGRIIAGIVVPAGFGEGIEAGRTQNISLLLDNSRFQVSPSVEAFVKAAVQETDARIGATFINSVWERLGSADNRLEATLPEINATRTRVQIMKESLEETSESLGALNISYVRSEIDAANLTVAGAMRSLSDAQANLTKIESDFAGYDEALRQTESDLSSINDSLSGITGYLANATAGVNCSDPAMAAYCASIISLNASVESPQVTVASRLEKVRAARRDLASANQTIQDFKASITSAMENAGEAYARLGNMLGFVDALERDRRDALDTIAEVDSSLDEITEKTFELEEIIADARSQIRQITSRTPESIISPMLVKSENLFGEKSFFEFMLPSLLPLLLMFICLFLASTSLVSERNGGTLARVSVSQVNPLEYAAVKVASYTVVLLPEALLLAFVASVFYGAFPLLDFGTWFVVVQALAMLTLAFVALGVLIAVYSESESTAFLASLVFGLPLLFLSGLLFPFEFMPQLVAAFATLSPLTQAVLSMQSAIVYHSPQVTGSLALLIYAAVFTLLAGFSLRRK